MICPYCHLDNSGVRETRRRPDGSIRRRHHCNTCDSKFTTVEVVVPSDDRGVEVVALPAGSLKALRGALGRAQG